jgi:flagellar basal body rod protein FlgC
MPCKLQIKENVENFVDKNSQRGLSMSLQDANILASNLNAKMKNHVVSFYNDSGKVGRIINIPNELVDMYFDIEVKRRTPVTSNINTIVKDGVEELFTSNPELANQVYQALGFRTPNITVLPNGNLKIVAFRTEKVGPTSKGEYQRGKGLYLSLDRPYPGEDVYTVEIEVSPKNLLDRKLGFGKISEDFFIDQKNKRVDKQLDTLAEFKQSLGIKAEIGSIDGALMNELVLFDKDLINQAIISKKEYNPQQKQQALQLYSQYLDTIFPDSQVKDIVYHIAGFERYNPKDPLADEEGYVPIKERFEKFESIEDSGVYFAAEMEYINYIKERVSKKRKEIYATIINLKNPINWKTTDTPYMVRDKITAEGKNNINDGVIGIEYEQFDRNGYPINNKNKITEYTTYWVKSDEQTHILGNKQDVEGFKNFVDNRPAPSANKFELDIKNLNLTPEVVNYLYQDSRAKSQGRDIENYKKEISKLINNLQSDFTNSEILETLKCI